MSTYIFGADSDVSAKTAVPTVADFLGEEGLATVVTIEPTEWVDEVVKALGLDATDEEPELNHLDTVIGPPVEDLVERVTKAGATYLDVSAGLTPLRHVPAEDIPETPDLENLPEAPKPKVRKIRKPMPEVPPTVKAVAKDKPAPRPEKSPAPVKEPVVEPVVEQVVEPVEKPTAEMTEAEMLRGLIALKLEAVSVPILWRTLDTLRGRTA